MVTAARLGAGALLGLLLVAPAAAHADDELVFHMIPLPSELLSKPIRLTGACSGVVVREWRVDVPGSEETKKAIKLLDVLCRGAVAAFPAFAENHNLKPQESGKLVWNISLLPDGDCYRCMNDKKRRFSHRFVPGNLWGYTDKNDQYAYLTNQVFKDGKPRWIWVRSVIHELWHSLSMASSIYDQHGWTDQERTAKDEESAKLFERAVLGW